MRLDSTPSPTIKNNPEAKLDPIAEIEGYLDRQNPDYLKKLKLYDSKIGQPMLRETKLVICIPVAGHQETENIYKTLLSFARQKNNPKEFEILLFLNFPNNLPPSQREAVNRTLREIENAKREFPYLQVKVLPEPLPQDQIRIGNLRKIVTDLALLRQRTAGITRDLILVSNDADNQGISEDYVSSYIRYFRDNPEKEGAVGNLQYDPQAFIRFPTVQLEQELATFLDQVGFENGNVMLFGNNSCMKSSIYAAIGGYPPGLKTAEQDWTGDTIRKLRKKKSTLGFVKEGPLVTSSRRAVTSHLMGLEESISFGDRESEKKMRDLEIESFPIFDYANKKALEKLRIDMERVIERLIEKYEKGDKLGKEAAFYKANLEKVGVKYTIDSSGKIKITNMDKFIRRQELMQKMIKGGEKNMSKVIEASWRI